MSKGFSTLFMVMFVGAVSLSVVFSLALVSSSSIRVSNTFLSSFRAKALSNACAEQGLMQIRNDTNFVGTGSLTLGGQGCTYTVLNTGGNTREIQASSAVNLAARKMKVIVSDIFPKIIISSWKEISDFSDISCACSDWTDVSCGNLSCTDDQMYQERTCNTAGCDLEQRCLSGHVSCQSAIIAFWNLDENNGTTVNDSINNNNGTIVGAVWSDDAILNSSLSFDGIDDNVNIPNNSVFDIAQNITVMSWVKASENKTARIIQKGDWDGWGIYQDLWAGWKVSIYTQENIGYSLDWNSSRPVLGQWYHLAYTYDGNTLKLYVDGVLKNSLSISGNLKINTRPISFGSDNGSQKFFHGLVDEVYLYNRTLSATEIQNYYNQNK